MALSRTFRCVNEDFAIRIRVQNTSGSAMYEGDGFYISSGTVTALADSNTVGIHGIWCEDVANGSVGACWIKGIFEVAVTGSGVGINFATGDPIYCADATTVDTGTKGDVAIGYIYGDEPANGAAKVQFVLKSQFLVSTKHA